VQDQLDTALQQRAAQWVDSLRRQGVTGIQLDPFGRLAVAARQDEFAKQQFAKRLATPGLSVDDRAYALLLAVRTFGADGNDTARMRTALDYQRQLDALPVSVVMQTYRGHVALGESFYAVGNGAQVVDQLTHAFSLVPQMPYIRRDWLHFRFAFLMLADVWSGMPQGRTRIDSVVTWLKTYAKAPPELLAQNEMYKWHEQYALEDLQRLAQMTGLLGRPAPSITAHFWLNTPTPATQSTQVPGAAVKTLNDGTIRLLEFGHYGCPGCLAALPKMERIRKSMPKSVEVWLVSQEGDVWGATRCTAPEMAGHLTKFYQKKQYGLPIAIWIGARAADEDGGSQIQESPMSATFQFFGWPTFVITDGQGLVRHIQFGFSEAPLMNSLKYLTAEAVRSGHPAGQATGSPVPPAASTAAPAPSGSTVGGAQ